MLKLRNIYYLLFAHLYADQYNVDSNRNCNFLIIFPYMFSPKVAQW